MNFFYFFVRVFERSHFQTKGIILIGAMIYFVPDVTTLLYVLVHFSELELISIGVTVYDVSKLTYLIGRGVIR